MVVAVYNKLCTNSILLGKPTGCALASRTWKRAECFWCRRALVNAENYLWGCQSATAVKARERLLPRTEEEVARFEALPGSTTAAKLKVYQRGILRYEPDKCCDYIE